MEFREVVRRRRMVRRYSDEPVDPAVVDRMLAHAQRAPSAGFSQGWAFLVLDTPDDVARFWESTGADPRTHNRWLDGMRTAPVVIVPLACKDAYLERYAEPDKGWTDRREDRWPVPYWYVDAGMASLLVLQTAVDEGLGACFFGIPGEHLDSFRAAFGVPEDHAPVGAITVGHRVTDAGATGSSARRERRTNLVHRGRWGTTVTP
jgi:nitroreductase